MAIRKDFIGLSLELDRSGLIWHPEIGDEISIRDDLERVSILVDPQGLTPKELRQQFLWLPNTEQIVQQLEARQALIYHAGINETFIYEAVVKTIDRVIETSAMNLRLAFGLALQEILTSGGEHLH